MKSGGQILWNAIATFEMSKTSWPTWKLRMNEDLGNHSKDLFFHSVSLVEYLPDSERQSKNSSIRKEGITRNLPRIYFDREGNLEGRHSDCWYWRIGKVGRIRNISQNTECKRSPDNPKRWRSCISCGRWFTKITRKRLRIPRTPLWDGDRP